MGIYSGYSKGTHRILKNAHTCASSDHIKNVLRHVDCVVLSASAAGERHCAVLVGGVALTRPAVVPELLGPEGGCMADVRG